MRTSRRAAGRSSGPDEFHPLGACREPRLLASADGTFCRYVDSLLAETERCVARSLAAGRLPRRRAESAELLGRVLLARLDANRQAADPALAASASRLAAAEQALRAVLDQWQGRRSATLEWIIIALIALDIVVVLC